MKEEIISLKEKRRKKIIKLSEKTNEDEFFK